MPRRAKPYRLIPELVPSDLWGRSAYRMLGRQAVWRREIRTDALAQAGNCCEVCGENGGRLICHDNWSYDDKKAIATLDGFKIHCQACDGVTHFGRLFHLPGGAPSEVLMSLTIHLCRVNRCKVEDAIKILTDAHELWEKRNERKWKIRVSPPLVKTYPALEALPSFNPPRSEY